MTVDELIADLENIRDDLGGGDSLVAVIASPGTGAIMLPHNVQSEHHHDGDGSVTVWIQSTER